MMRLKKLIPLLVIILLAGVLRLYALDRYPAGLNADEAAIGYNAYSLLQTGKDEDGASWPIVFESFGDYKPGGYFYVVMPFVKVMGLNILAVRLPSAILGVVAAWLVYLLAGEVTLLSLGRESERYQLFAALLLAISPWHLQFSRGGWEVNVGTTLLLAGVVCLLKGLKRRWLLLPSAIFFVLSMYVYQSTRLLAPVMAVGLAVIFIKRLWPPTKELWLSAVAGLILVLPVLAAVFGPGGLSRFSGVGLSADTGPVSRVDELRGHYSNPNNLVVRLLHNKPLAYVARFGENYLDHFSGFFLFLEGDVIQRNRVPDMGEMYLVEIPFLLLGVWFWIRKGGMGSTVIFFWLGVAPLAAALTFQTPHALRAQNMVVPLFLIAAAGLDYLWRGLLQVKRWGRFVLGLAMGLIALGYVWNVLYYLDQYYVEYPQVYPAAWEYGFDQVAVKVVKLSPKYKRVVMTDTYDQPYIEMLFFLKYPPEIFQEEVVLTPRDRFGFSTVRHFGKFDFMPVVWGDVSGERGTLVVGTPQEIPASARVIDRVLFPNGQPGFVFALI